jgi:ABC-type Zn uptake system ZnuABC Zn-binding protein ZnuA
MILFLCLNSTGNAQDETIKIVCTNSILADFTSNILVNNSTIEYIMPSGACPAYYDCPPSDVDKILSADILISLGDSKKEPWLSDLIEFNTDLEIIECKNLGEWNIPSGAIKYVNCLSANLTIILTELNETIDENTNNYLLRINQTAERLIDKIENNNSKNIKIISMQWHQDFLKWLGLDVVYSYGPPQGLSLQDKIDVINTATSNEVYVVVDNLQSGTDFGAEISSETGTSHIIFTNFPGAIPGTDSYLDMISYNTDQLIEGIKSFEYKQGDIANLENQVSNIELQRNIVIVLMIIFFIISLILFLMYKKK